MATLTLMLIHLLSLILQIVTSDITTQKYLELAKEENMLLFVCCTETTESKPVKLETSFSDASPYIACYLVIVILM